jgi:quinohemoprotein ethanol dehydrogenase
MSRRRFGTALAFAVGIPLICASATFARPFSSGSLAASTAAAIEPAPAFTPAQQQPYAAADWLTIGGNLSNDRYSTLTQINRTNVGGLRRAWRTVLPRPSLKDAGALGGRPSFQANALAYKGVLYISTGANQVFALDGQTGQILWRYDAGYTRNFKPLIAANRGLALGDGKVFIAQLDNDVVALNQLTGAVLWKTQLGRTPEGYTMTSPPLYYDGLLIGGMSGGDWGGRGFLFALDAKTGDERWRFYVAPGPGEIGNNTWFEDEWMRGGGAIWLASSVDPALDMIYFVTGNPIPWNGRGPGQNLFTDSIVALDIHTGDYRWHFQATHHDIWDYDLPNPPYLFDVMVRGTLRKGIAAAAKTGWVYVLDRATGAPLYGIVERKVPQDRFSNTWPTQPYPVGDTFVGQCSTRKQWPNPAPDGKLYKVGCIYTPYNPSRFLASRPAAGGGVDWPPTSYNPDTSLAYVCATDGAGTGLGAIRKRLQRFIPGNLSAIGVNFGGGSPVESWGYVAAMDMRTNKRAWRVRWPTPCYSGSVTTAGGLVFVGTTEGRYLAYDALRGQLLWRSPKVVDAIINAPGTTYQAGGKQYVVIATRGIKEHDKINAYALP